MNPVLEMALLRGRVKRQAVPISLVDQIGRLVSYLGKTGRLRAMRVIANEDMSLKDDWSMDTAGVFRSDSCHPIKSFLVNHSTVCTLCLQGCHVVPLKT